MARIVSSDYIPVLTLHARTILESGVEIDKPLRENSMVTNLRYIENEEIYTITGRVSNIGYTAKPITRSYRNVATAKSTFDSDVVPTTIDIDCSTEYNSNIVTIPVMEIIEDEGVLDVKRMKCTLSYAVNVVVELTDRTTEQFSIKEGDQLVGLTYLDRLGDTTVDAKVVAFRYDKKLQPTAMVVVVNNRIKEIDIEAIKSVDGVTTPVVSNTETAITDAIAASESGIVYLGSSTFTEPVSVTKDVTIRGVRAGIPANVVDTKRAVATPSDETVLEGTLTVADGVSLTLDGVTLTKDAYLSVKNAKDITIKNCIIKGLIPTSNRSCIINSTKTELKVDIQGCYFGNNEVVDGNAFYNLFEGTWIFADGSTFANNYFEAGVCTHNTINLYYAAENANIVIDKNVWEKSSNGIRIGFVGDTKCIVDINNNTYNSTDEEYPEYAGLVLVQPFLKETTTMENVVIYINNTTHSDEHQLYYLYAGANDTPFTEYNVPTIIVDGTVEVAPAEKPVVEEPDVPETTEPTPEQSEPVVPETPEQPEEPTDPVAPEENEPSTEPTEENTTTE